MTQTPFNNFPRFTPRAELDKVANALTSRLRDEDDEDVRPYRDISPSNKSPKPVSNPFMRTPTIKGAIIERIGFSARIAALEKDVKDRDAEIEALKQQLRSLRMVIGEAVKVLVQED